MQHPFHILDVFTDQVGAGNPLAVVLHAGNLELAVMQQVARDFNLSETVFVGEPDMTRNEVAIRIFTPERELDFAGHPTVGAAVLLCLLRGVSAIRLTENVGLLHCLVDKIDSKRGAAQFSLPSLPARLDGVADDAAIAQQLGINESDIGFAGLRPAIYSVGVPFTLVPVANAQILEGIHPERREWSKVFSGPLAGVYIFAPTPDERGVDYAARMFSPGMPLGEDPATGAAAGALIGLLAQLEKEPDCQRNLVLRQGKELGRPSEIRLIYRFKNGALVQCGLGGKAVIVKSGKMDI